MCSKQTKTAKIQNTQKQVIHKGKAMANMVGLAHSKRTANTLRREAGLSMFICLEVQKFLNWKSQNSGKGSLLWMEGEIAGRLVTLCFIYGIFFIFLIS